jgi:hypothetical protein
METVTQNQVLTQEELQSLKTIQEETQALVIELGEIELISLQLEERKNNAKKFLVELGEREKTFTQSIFDKYGKVSINPSTGEIASIPN